MVKQPEKERRMTLRRELGNRLPSAEVPVPSEQAVGRSALLIPYACFSCRKSFKRKCEEGLPVKRCPHCGGSAVGLSPNFRAPPMSDIQQWKLVAFLVKHGFRFYHQYDDGGSLVSYPTTLREAKEFVAQYGADA